MTETTETTGRQAPHPAGGEPVEARVPADLRHVVPREPQQPTAPPRSRPPEPRSPAVATVAATAAARGHGGRLALAVLLLGQFMAILDVSIVNVALPTLRTDLRTSDAGLQLVVAGYVLSYAVLLITGARLGGIVGHRRTFLAGLAVFTLASAACGLAPGTGTLIGFRFVQGAGAALMTPQVMSMIQRTFTGPARARALGLYTTVVAGGIVVGQAAGGLLVSADLFGSGWRPVFLVNVPVGVVLLAVGRRVLPVDGGRHGAGLDLPGVLVISPAVLLVVLPLILGHDEGWPAWCAASMAAGVALFGLFAAVERRVAARGGRPLISARVLRAPGLLPAVAVLILAPASWGAFLFTTTLHLQGELGMGALGSGLAFIPCVVAFGLVSLNWQRLPGHWHSRLIPAGFALAAVAYLWIGPLAGGGVGYEALTAVIGLGLGVMPIVMTVALAHVPVEDAPDASGLLLTVMQLGQVTGVATVGTVFLTVAADSHSTRHAEYATGWSLAATALAAACAALVLARRRASVTG
ncbi:MFS transporter [Frankia sp. CNm7]|uniref:MFS transporter n=1 Tax=Frankia nepalensis TaxID=1836974 RepID=A0A937R605_9ACTN|nr:MFS transporter [Frankia nepalensis]MBL7499358.1 MFS transporter [Frankia nepalensis]MBL7514116.1 MFS transporter [Frankia nepalensis]MBL7519231.1 MFS transporter [Frankia nepalensis]MBL7626373.1 MFS transporter [Frankia nepalensis]